jgi:uncharacterized protein (DUF427 family)
VTVAVQGPPILENTLIGPKPEAIEIRLEPIAKRVRAFVGGVAIADSCRVMMMFETARLGVYYFPIEDVRTDLLVATSRVVRSDIKGDAAYYSITVDGTTVDNAAWRYGGPIAGCPAIAGFVAFHWKSMDAWFEEDDEVFVHARDPYHRIDVLNSSREVRVVVGGLTVALTRRARFLFETSLPVRYYIPKEDVRMELLQPSEMKTACAYKGPTSWYWQAQAADRSVSDIAWCYDNPAPEVAAIAGMVAFFNERADAICVDGNEMPRPRTKWSLVAEPRKKHNKLTQGES